ncbi:hypothetical protein [Butyrivibrio sp. AE2032]|uniref:hypothetical protein n=1 Tax=Butyrivibrio sp. AE2032 TaxID=1458463 RepID=UPI00068F65C9|nr:hypothetical protein [Butyrivibrio sp. AE2032]
MGSGSYTAHDWDRLRKTRGITTDAGADNLFKNKTMLDKFNPKFISKRESRDNDEHPNSTPIAIGVDVTGSMGYLSEEIVKNSLNELMKKLYASNVIPDPQLMFAAIGDVGDAAPLQVTQYESDIRIAEQLLELWLEGRGGDGPEDYSLFWYFLARHTDTDSMKKRQQKGFAFTIGDAPNHPKLSASAIKKIFGDDQKSDMTLQEVFEETEQSYYLFHINITSGGDRTVIDGRTINIRKDSVSLLPELIISVICKVKGLNRADILGDLSADVNRKIDGMMCNLII